jgi:hypothetical protein
MRASTSSGWLRTDGIRFGPVFRMVTQRGTVELGRLSAEGCG